MYQLISARTLRQDIIYILRYLISINEVIPYPPVGQVQKKWGVLSVMLFIMISAYKSMYGQDKRITLIHMLSANKPE